MSSGRDVYFEFKTEGQMGKKWVVIPRRLVSPTDESIDAVPL